MFEPNEELKETPKLIKNHWKDLLFAEVTMFGYIQIFNL